VRRVVLAVGLLAASATSLCCNGLLGVQQLSYTPEDGGADTSAAAGNGEAGPPSLNDGGEDGNAGDATPGANDAGIDASHFDASSDGSPDAADASTVHCDSGAETACNGVCVDEQTDPSNCGTCGRACGSGSTCSGGQCSPVTVCTTATAALGAELTIVGGAAYWMDGSEIHAAIDSCSLTAVSGTATVYMGGSRTIGGSYARNIASDGRLGMYLSSAVQEANVPPGQLAYGAPPNALTTIFGSTTWGSSSSSGVAFAVDPSTGRVFITLAGEVDALEGTTTDAGPNALCLPMPTATDTIGLTAAGGGKLFAFDSTTSEIYGVTVASNGTCSAPVTIATNIPSVGGVTVSALATDGTQVFFGDPGGVYACSAATGCGASPTTLAVTPGTVGGIVFDSTNVYWTGTAGGSTGLVTCARGGCGGFPTVLVASAPTGPLGIYASNIYFLSGGVSLNRVAKW
jgi:hypothetical protein